MKFIKRQIKSRGWLNALFTPAVTVSCNTEFRVWQSLASVEFQCSRQSPQRRGWRHRVSSVALPLTKSSAKMSPIFVREFNGTAPVRRRRRRRPVISTWQTFGCPASSAAAKWTFRMRQLTGIRIASSNVDRRRATLRWLASWSRSASIAERRCPLSWSPAGRRWVSYGTAVDRRRWSMTSTFFGRRRSALDETIVIVIPVRVMLRWISFFYIDLRVMITNVTSVRRVMAFKTRRFSCKKWNDALVIRVFAVIFNAHNYIIISADYRGFLHLYIFKLMKPIEIKSDEIKGLIRNMGLCVSTQAKGFVRLIGASHEFVVSLTHAKRSWQTWIKAPKLTCSWNTHVSPLSQWALPIFYSSSQNHLARWRKRRKEVEFTTFFTDICFCGSKNSHKTQF